MSLPDRELPPLDAGALWERFHAELLAFARRRTDSEETAHEILQSAFLNAHRHLAGGTVPENPRAWLYQIVRNLVFDARRHEARQRRLEAGLAPPLDRADPRDGPPSDDPTAFAIVARALPRFINALPPMYRDALRMTELEGLTQADAARRARVSVSGMKSRVQRARKQLFDALQRCCALEVDRRGHMFGCTPHRADRDCC